MSNFGEESSRKEIVWEDNIRWEDSVKLYLREIGYLGVEWIHLAWAREVIIVVYVKFIIMKCYCMSLLHSVVSDVNCYMVVVLVVVALNTKVLVSCGPDVTKVEYSL